MHPPFVDHGGPLLSHSERSLVQRQVDDWLDDGVAEASSLKQGTYLLVATNAKGKARVCPAFLALNQATVFKDHRMPTADAVRRLVN